MKGRDRGAELIPAKRHLETANSEVFASLRRMYGEPRNHASILQGAAAMANGNVRLTRLLNLLLLHLANKPPPVTEPALAEWEDAASSALEVLAATWEESDERSLKLALSRLEGVDLGGSHQNHDAWIFAQFARASTELSAMLIDALPKAEASKLG